MRWRRMKCALAAMAASGAVAAIPAVLAPAAQAETGAHGVVAIHTGPWGYREVVSGKGTTQQLHDLIHRYGAVTNTPIGYLVSMGAWAAINPFAGAAVQTYMWTVQYKVDQAVARNTCFALVRLTSWPNVYWPGVEPWGCR